MAVAKKGDTVKVHYTGTLDDGTTFDTSTNRDPLQFTIGSGQVIPGFEQAVIGMNAGESKTVNIPSDEAYGQYYAELVMAVDKNQLPDDLNPEVGQQLEVRRTDGKTIIVTVTEISASQVTLDANHPLAGKDLTFNILLVNIS